jgi:phage terminase large subunit-like protein
MAKLIKKKLSSEHEQLRLVCESSLIDFIEFVHPRRLLGNIHRDVINWWNRQDAKSHQMLLLPRDHGKSALLAYRVAWSLTKDPTKRILLISSTSNLATKQLKFIKDILTSDKYRILWPEMVNREEVKREKWTEREISVDHPLRRDWAIRDPSIFTAGLTSNIVGLHCDIAALDDIVVAGNAYTEEGREKTEEQYGLLSSIETVNSQEWVVGTRYHPLDLYAKLAQLEIERWDAEQQVTHREPLFETEEYPVENIGDGTGEFLWPRQQGKDGKWFGFDQEILSVKRSQYINKTHFRAQYYNDPTDIGSAPISRDQFQYYDPQFLGKKNARWYFKGNPLNVVAAVDFAYTVNKRSDYSCIVVVGADTLGNYFVMDIDRFKTDKHSEYYKHILKLYELWGFTRIRAEVTAAQKVIITDLKENYIRPNGLSLAIDEYHPSRWQGSKEERILATLEPRYANKQIWHYPGGNCQVLEEELIFANPAHDDVKDALASAVDFVTQPLNLFRLQKMSQTNFNFHSKFGGVT